MLLRRVQLYQSLLLFFHNKNELVSVLLTFSLTFCPFSAIAGSLFGEPWNPPVLWRPRSLADSAKKSAAWHWRIFVRLNWVEACCEASQRGLGLWIPNPLTVIQDPLWTIPENKNKGQEQKTHGHAQRTVDVGKKPSTGSFKQNFYDNLKLQLFSGIPCMLWHFFPSKYLPWYPCFDATLQYFLPVLLTKGYSYGTSFSGRNVTKIFS